MTVELDDNRRGIWSPPSTVYATFTGGFGDLWGTANYFLRLSEDNRSEICVFDMDPRIKAIISHLDSRGLVREVRAEADVLIFSHRDPTLLATYPHRVLQMIVPWMDIFGAYFPTRGMRWRPNRSRVIAAQLIANDPLDPKSCTPAERAFFTERLDAAGYDVVELGLPRSIAENIAIASRAEAFVGVCSGMSHLCHSVGVPVHLIRNGHPSRLLEKYHRGNRFTEHSNVIEALTAFA